MQINQDFYYAIAADTIFGSFNGNGFVYMCFFFAYKYAALFAYNNIYGPND